MVPYTPAARHLTRRAGDPAWSAPSRRRATWRNSATEDPRDDLRYPRICIRTGKHKYIYSPFLKDTPGFARCSALAKAFGCKGIPAPEELFFLEMDPHERVNRAERDSTIARKYKSLLKGKLNLSKKMETGKRLKMFKESWNRFEALGYQILE